MQETITLEQFENDRPARGRSTKASPQLIALRNMAIDTAIVLDHTGLQCRIAKGENQRACSFQSIMQRVAKETNSRFQSYHRPDGKLAVARFDVDKS